MGQSCKITAKPGNIKELLTSWYFWKPFLGITGGLAAGFLYNYFVENRGIAFEITQDTWTSVFLGGMIGYYLTACPCTRIGR
jgi:hypothetical protein